MTTLSYTGTLLLLLPMSLFACNSETNDTSTDLAKINTRPEVSIILELGLPDSTVSRDGGIGLDVSADALLADASPADMSVANPDAAPPITINTCDEACAHYVNCDRLDVFGDENACLAACARSSRDGTPEDWFRCLATESCNLLHRCRPPEPRTLTCPQVCMSLGECVEEVVIADCPAECDVNNGSGAFGRCGEEIYGGACAMEAFWPCLGREVYTGCVDRCTTGVVCNLVRAQDCLTHCITEVTSLDPLERHRAGERNLCVRLAGNDCPRADQCLNPMIEPHPNGPPSQQAFCQRWDMCFANTIPCDQIWVAFGPTPAAANCAFQLLAGPCPADPLQIIQQCLGAIGNPPPQDNGCADYCEALEICQELPEGQNRITCLQVCGDALQQADEVEAELAAERIVCGQQNNCADLGACIDAASP
jgi:hypothetical protein